MFEKVSRSLKYDSKIFLVHKHIYIYVDTNTDHFTPLALHVRGNSLHGCVTSFGPIRLTTSTCTCMSKNIRGTLLRASATYYIGIAGCMGDDCHLNTNVFSRQFCLLQQTVRASELATRLYSIGTRRMRNEETHCFYCNNGGERLRQWIFELKENSQQLGNFGSKLFH